MAGTRRRDTLANSWVHYRKAPKYDTPRSSDSLYMVANKYIQSDATRTANLELKIQSRVTSELERLAAAEESKLKSLADEISKSSDTPSSSPDASTLTDKLTGAAADKEKKAALSHSSVSNEIESLKKKLGERRKVEQVDAGVQKAKDELVNCLRVNDRRPLDCWKEREAFKREVGRLEKDFVERTVR
jgi:altered-inheritance-of-mitochondria protein 13